MTIIYVLIPLGLVLLLAAVAAFFWAVRAGQFDDLETPAWRVLLDDDRRPPEQGRVQLPPGQAGTPASAEHAGGADQRDERDQDVGGPDRHDRAIHDRADRTL